MGRVTFSPRALSIFFRIGWICSNSPIDDAWKCTTILSLLLIIKSTITFILGIGINTGIGVYPSEFENDEVYQTLIQNQKIASETLSKYGIKALLEPINTVDQPDFYINTSAQAVDLINQIDHPNAFLLYDVYHMQIMEGNLSRNIKKLIDLIGHIQIADNPGRYEPGTGEINYPYIFNLLDEITPHLS